MNWTSASLNDVFRLAMPMGTELVTRNADLDQKVSWACCSRPSPPVFPSLEGGELALISMRDLQVLDPAGTLGQVLHRLVEAQIAGVGVQGEFEIDAIEIAHVDGLPLFVLPDQVSLHQVERDIIRLIVDRSAYILQRATNLQRELNQITLDGGGLEAIARQIQHVTEQPFIVLNANGHIVTAGGVAVGQGSLGQLQRSLPNVMQLRSWAVGRNFNAAGRSNGILSLAAGSRSLLREYHECAVEPVIVSEEIQGYCLLLRHGTEQAPLSPIEEIAITQGAAAAAMDWVTRNAVGAAENRMRASFLDELLASSIADEQAWIRRGQSVGYDLEKPHAAWMLEGEGIADWPAAVLTPLNERWPNLLSSLREHRLLVYCPLTGEQEDQSLESKRQALDIVEAVLTANPQGRLHIGVGGVTTAPSGWLRSQQQAWEGLRVNKIWGTSAVTLFEDLGLYQFLTALRSFPETETYCQSTLGALREYDEKRKAELLDTLNAFFMCHGNISLAAAGLQIHRNTLTYRLNRIAEITHLDLDDADVRFGLQLAIKLHQLRH